MSTAMRSNLAGHRGITGVPKDAPAWKKAIISQAKALDMGLQAVSLAAGLSGGTIRRFVTSDIPPSVDTLQAVARVLGMRFIVTGKGIRAEVIGDEYNLTGDN